MPYQAGWFVPHRVIDARIWGQLTLDELEAYMDTCASLLAEALTDAPANTVHLLMDVLDADSIPRLYLHVSRGVRVLRFKNRGTMFLVVQNSGIRSIVEVTAYLSRDLFPLRVFRDRQSALEALTSHLEKERLP